MAREYESFMDISQFVGNPQQFIYTILNGEYGREATYSLSILTITVKKLCSSIEGIGTTNVFKNICFADVVHFLAHLEPKLHSIVATREWASVLYSIWSLEMM